LQARITARIGQAIRLNLVHDGTAAALAYAGERHAVILMLGTSIGVGFVPKTSDGLMETPVVSAVQALEKRIPE
jgi:hypothetical protein